MENEELNDNEDYGGGGDDFSESYIFKSAKKK